ncbi:RNA-binding protein with serine-rich domain 1-like isoform X1 [Festucalex cinctus]
MRLSLSRVGRYTAPLPAKKEDDKSKQGVKRKSEASNVGAEKDQGRVKSRTRRSASSGSSSSSSGSGSSSSSSTSSSASGSSSSRSSSSSPSSSSPSPKRQRQSRRRSSSKSKVVKKEVCERRKRTPAPKPTKVYLGRLTRNVIKEHIQEIFSTYGKIKMIDMPMNRIHPHLSKGYAYIEFETAEEAENALKHMDGGQIDGQEITVIAVLTPTVRAPPRRMSPARRMPPPPPTWRRSPPRMRRRSTRSPRRRSPVRRRSRSFGRRRHRSRSSSNSSR